MTLPAPRYRRQRRHHRYEQYARQCTRGSSKRYTRAKKASPHSTVQYNSRSGRMQSSKLSELKYNPNVGLGENFVVKMHVIHHTTRSSKVLVDTTALAAFLGTQRALYMYLYIDSIYFHPRNSTREPVVPNMGARIREQRRATKVESFKRGRTIHAARSYRTTCLRSIPELLNYY